MNEQDKLKLIRFVASMEIEQVNNEYKGAITDWDASVEEKMFDFDYHMAKLHIAMKEEKKGAIREFIADCANILLAIGDSYGVYDKMPGNNEKCYSLKEPALTKGPIKSKEPEETEKGVTYFS